MTIILIILLVCVSAITITAGLHFLWETGKDRYCLLLVLVGIAIAVGAILLAKSKFQPPTKQDVIDGKAYYQESQVITGNDTIKTYDIVWK